MGYAKMQRQTGIKKMKSNGFNTCTHLDQLHNECNQDSMQYILTFLPRNAKEVGPKVMGKKTAAKRPRFGSLSFVVVHFPPPAALEVTPVLLDGNFNQKCGLDLIEGTDVRFWSYKCALTYVYVQSSLRIQFCTCKVASLFYLRLTL